MDNRDDIRDVCLCGNTMVFGSEAGFCFACAYGEDLPEIEGQEIEDAYRLGTTESEDAEFWESWTMSEDEARELASDRERLSIPCPGSSFE